MVTKLQPTKKIMSISTMAKEPHPTHPIFRDSKLLVTPTVISPKQKVLGF